MRKLLITSLILLMLSLCGGEVQARGVRGRAPVARARVRANLGRFLRPRIVRRGRVRAIVPRPAVRGRGFSGRLR